jgi:hypothetical protein
LKQILAERVCESLRNVVLGYSAVPATALQLTP